MGKKFDEIYESVIGRYNVGGYIPGDIVKFRPNYKSSATYQAMNSVMKKEVDDLVNSGLNIRITQVGDRLSGESARNQHRLASDIVLTVAGDQGGGRSYASIAVSPDMVDVVSTQEFAPTVPDQFYRKDNSNFKPEEFKPDTSHDSRLTDKGNRKNTPTDLKLAGESKVNDKDALGFLFEELTQNQ